MASKFEIKYGEQPVAMIVAHDEPEALAFFAASHRYSSFEDMLTSERLQRDTFAVKDHGDYTPPPVSRLFGKPPVARHVPCRYDARWDEP